MHNGDILLSDQGETVRKGERNPAQRALLYKDLSFPHGTVLRLISLLFRETDENRPIIPLQRVGLHKDLTLRLITVLRLISLLLREQPYSRL